LGSISPAQAASATWRWITRSDLKIVQRNKKGTPVPFFIALHNFLYLALTRSPKTRSGVAAQTLRKLLQRGNAAILGTMAPVLQLLDQMLFADSGACPDSGQFLTQGIGGVQGGAGENNRAYRVFLLFGQVIFVQMQPVLDACHIQFVGSLQLQPGNFCLVGFFQKTVHT